MTTEEQDRFKTKLKDVPLSCFKLFSDNLKFENNLSAEEINSLKAPMSNTDIITHKPGKGNTVVITDQGKYIEGVKRAISDSNRFFQLNITPGKYLNYIINIEKKFRRLFKDLLDNDNISKDEYDKICPKSSRPGILYGILTSINQLLIPIPVPLTHDEFTIKDSFSFAKDITTFDSSLYMASLDVESLFTNIPLNETINNCVSELQNKNLCNKNLSKRELFKRLETATSESSFIFDYLLYKQVDEVAMSSLLGSTLANAFLCHYEKEWLDNCPIHYKPVIYQRYVDNIFVLFSSKEPLQLFVDYMNKQHKSLKLISEAENDNSFSFLDIKITRRNQQFKIFVYRKPIFSHLFTHYESDVDQTYKKSLIDTLLFRCFSICSD